MNTTYYQMMDTMEKAGVDWQYIDGWACGYLHNPPRGEQYVTEGYEAGYEDGRNGNMEGYTDWLNQVG
jgi:hypothetical protein